MFRHILLAVALLVAPTAAAQDGAYRPGLPVTDTNPPPAKCVVWNGSAYVACGAAGASTPVTGTYNTTPPTLTNGQRSDLQLDSRANLEVALFGANSPTPVSSSIVVPAARANSGVYGLDVNSVGRLVSGTSTYAITGTTAGYQYTVQTTEGSLITGVPPVASTALESGRVLKATPGSLFGLDVVSGATAGYVMAFNSTTVPADGPVTPVKCYVLAPNSSLDLNLRAAPAFFSVGISVAFSTTGCFTKTASATVYFSGDVK